MYLFRDSELKYEVGQLQTELKKTYTFILYDFTFCQVLIFDQFFLQKR